MQVPKHQRCKIPTKESTDIMFPAPALSAAERNKFPE